MTRSQTASEPMPGSETAGLMPSALPSPKPPALLMVSVLASGFRPYRSACEDLAERLERCGYTLHRTSDREGRLQRIIDMTSTAWRCRNEFEVAYVDLFSGWAFWWADLTCALLRKMGKPYVLTLRGGSLPSHADRWPGRMRTIMSGAAAVVAPSSYLARSLAPFRQDIRIIANPVEVDRYPYRERTRLRPRLVWLRSFHEIYDPVLAVNVVDALRTRHPDVRLEMTGPDKRDGSRGEVEQRVRERGLEDYVSVGSGVPKSAVPEVLGRGDVFLNTTTTDNTPISVIEAMACGLCVVSTNVGGIADLLDHERDALLVPAGDPEAMAAAVSRLLHDHDLAAGISKRARKKAESFDVKVILPRWDELMRRVATNA